jgi:hypothetical protein
MALVPPVIGLGFLFGPLFHARQLMAPEALERARPFVNRPDGLGVGAIEHLAPLSPYVHQTDIAEHLEMLGNGGLREAERRNDVRDWPLGG